MLSAAAVTSKLRRSFNVTGRLQGNVATVSTFVKSCVDIEAQFKETMNVGKEPPPARLSSVDTPVAPLEESTQLGSSGISKLVISQRFPQLSQHSFLEQKQATEKGSTTIKTAKNICSTTQEKELDPVDNTVSKVTPMIENTNEEAKEKTHPHPYFEYLLVKKTRMKRVGNQRRVHRMVQTKNRRSELSRKKSPVTTSTARIKGTNQTYDVFSVKKMGSLQRTGIPNLMGKC